MAAISVLTVLGARPQFIKASAISRALVEDGGFEESILYTGQHFDPEMSDVFFDDLGLPAPKWSLGVHGGSHGDMTGRMLIGIDPLLRSERPDVVLVYGDTNSTLAGALAASKEHIPVAHVEAGLRSFNRQMPEEINRVLTDHMSALLFCPTRASVENLKREGIRNGVHQVGDVMYDVAVHAASLGQESSGVLEEVALAPGSYALATIHRAENTDDPWRLRQVIAFVESDAERDNLAVLMPLHPRTRAALERYGLSLQSIVALPPVGYLEMAQLVRNAARIYTDSGGLQKEAYFHRVPCVTLREETEWVETISAGWNRLWRESTYEPRREIAEYGDGLASAKIVDRLNAELNA